MPRSTFLSGKDAVMRYFQDGKELVALNAKTWDFGPSVTKFRDGVNGEKRNRTGSQTDHYELNLELWIDNLDQVDTFLIDRDNEDAEAVPSTRARSCSSSPATAARRRTRSWTWCSRTGASSRAAAPSACCSRSA